MDAQDGKVTCEIGIAMAVERLLREGFSVAVPLVDEGYDLIAFRGRSHWRLQVKSSGSNSPKHRTRVRIRCGKFKHLRYSSKHVDAFVCVNIRTRVVMCVPVAVASDRSWLNWSEADRWSDFLILHRIKQQRCSSPRIGQRSRNQNGRA